MAGLAPLIATTAAVPNFRLCRILRLVGRLFSLTIDQVSFVRGEYGLWDSVHSDVCFFID